MLNKEKTPIGEFIKMKYGKMPPADILSDEGYPIFSGYRITGYAKEFLYEEPMLVLVARGVGGTGDVKISPPNSWITNLSIILEVDKEKADKRFLFYKLSSEPLKDNLNTGAAQAQITVDVFSKYKIYLPPLETQKRIAEILSAYDDLIENNLKRIKLLEESARLLYREWFVRLKFPNYEHTPLIDGLPEGWAKVNLKEVCKINEKSLSSSFDGEIEYIDIASVTPNSINETTSYNFKDAPSRARRIVKHGDIIWSCVRPNRKSHAFIWNPQENVIASTGFAVISPKILPTSYLYFEITKDSFVGYLENRARGAAYPAVTAKDFEESEILKPNEKITLAFDEIVTPIFSQAQNLKIQNQKLKQARDLLLPRLMSGEMAV